MMHKKGSGEQKPKEGRSPHNQKQIYAMVAGGVLLLVLGFVMVLIPALLSDEDGHYDNGWPFAIAAFSLMIAALAVLLRVAPEATLLTYEKKLRKLADAPLTFLPGVGRQRVEKLLWRAGFEETPSGLYRKKIYSPVKGGIWFYAALADADAPLDQLCEELTERLGKAHDKKKGWVCLIPFFYKAGAARQDREELHRLGTSAYASNAAMDAAGVYSIVPVLVDTRTGEGCCFAHEKGITVYAYGCRFLKKHLA